MNSLDLIFLSILAYTLIRGIYRGLVKEFASIFGLVVGFLAANHFYEQLAQHLDQLISSPKYAAIISYVLLFFLALGLILFIGQLLKKVLQLVMLSWLDRLGGALLGFGKGALFCCLILFLLMLFLPSQADLFSSSLSTPYVSRFSRSLSSLVPRRMKQGFEQGSQRLQEQWEDNLLHDLRHPE